MIEASGLKFILPGVILTAIFALLAASKDSLFLFIMSLILAVLTLFLVFFYRNPSRQTPQGDDLVLSAADGRVLSVEDTENEFIGGRGHKVSIFLSVFDVHINRIPATGTVEYVKYNPGKFLAAFKDKASDENEQTEIALQFKQGKLVFKQIAGILARRIVCRLSQSQPVSAGEIFGLIHFGSRTELFLPEGVKILVKPGDKVKGGETIIGRIVDNRDDIK